MPLWLQAISAIPALLMCFVFPLLAFLTCFLRPCLLFSSLNLVYSQATFDDPALLPYHQRFQHLLLFYIESCSYIQPDNVWQLLILYKKRNNNHYFAGYVSLYSFFCYPDGRRLRLSQMFVRPDEQRKGHGTRLLNVVYCVAVNEGYVEVNVEDPSPDFRLIRDSLDLMNCRRAGFFAGDGQSLGFGRMCVYACLVLCLPM